MSHAHYHIGVQCAHIFVVGQVRLERNGFYADLRESINEFGCRAFRGVVVYCDGAAARGEGASGCFAYASAAPQSDRHLDRNVEY